MRIIKSVLVLLLSTILAICYISCDDAGVTTVSQSSNFSVLNLKPLTAEDSAMYELFVSFDTLGNIVYYSMGKFNVNASGQIIDSAGHSKVLKFDFAPNLANGNDAIVTLEPLNDNDTLPNGPRILGASKTFVNGILTFIMNMEYSGVLGNIATQLKTDSVKYILASPTGAYPSSNFVRGIWFTPDSSGSSAGISSLPINGTGWIYHAWIIDTRDSINDIYNVGRFYNPNGADDYIRCYGMNPQNAYNKPGEDWLIANCPGPAGIPDITNLNNGDYKILITLEPETHYLTKPFFIKLFYGTFAGIGFNIPALVTNVAASYFPTASLQITINNSH
jgi:hypothetical protein